MRLGTALASVSVVEPPLTSAEPSALPRVTLIATVRELGTLGGARSSPADREGNLVVGSSTTAAGVQHAFAYDLSTSTTRDLGTLGGPATKLMWQAGEGETWISVTGSAPAASRLIEKGLTLRDLT